MPSRSDGDYVFGEGANSSDEAPTHNPPWPYVNPFAQGRFERQCIADGETIRFDNLPKMPSWAPWFGVNDALTVFLVLKRIKSHTTTMQRPLTGVEANAIAEHSAYAARYFAWTPPVSYALALAFAVARRHTFSFPLYKPKMKTFNPDFFPTRKFHVLKGNYARRIWHTLRFAAYTPLCWIPTTVFFTSMSENSFTAHAKRDPRLAAMIQEGRKKLQQEHAHAQLRRRPGAPDPAGTVAPQTPQQTSDEASGQVYGSAGYSAQSSNSFERPVAAPEPPRATQPNRASSSRRVDDDSDGLFDDDDASPVAASARGQEVGQGRSGSSWDRIRQQAKSGSPNWEGGDSSGQERGWGQLRQDKTQDSRDRNPKTDNYSYSSDDEERERRNYEKEQAQKEFDALLDAERRGESGSSGNRGWRK
ncbi:hypothetical protein F4678DRAFT_163696 [Xylaria arbuscula]|nr:hypothetical protein F4678DRAFT_163696 [Xylaria arbuscula]